ncbi:LPS export ABC transporter periplasmic protein LptC [Leptolyngbya sp. 7M]|uniref:LPS export ABC transporter periplasmic protein LptC n=1 Tax=Leptolyngbya sp. 7M TaxID=2812896 RepID=UPI001B8D542F|nr:LPS export ABC transporter periplasmic protein LptC [Leptolyngbya sp. 7M]QYO67559.1 LPS export ABC transporter periplasmic protein LptC [Leptolyngbya sp. 7M]
MPKFFRYGTVAIGIAVILIIGISFLSQKEPEFRMRGFPANLSDKVTAVVEGYERKEIEGDVVKFYIKADKATTFDDQHQEFENIFLQVFAPDGTFDSITAQKSVYVPHESKDFTVYFAGNVEMTSRDGLKANTEQFTYKRGIDTAEAEEKIRFNRGNIEGSAASAIVKLSERKIDLLGDVALSMVDQSPNGKITISKVTSEAGGYDQANEVIKLNGSVAGSFINRNGSELETSTIKAGLVNIQLTPLENSKRDVRMIELFQNVSIDLVRNGKPEANVRAEYAKHDVVHDGFYLRTSALVERFSTDAKTQIAGDRVDYLRTAGKAISEGNASVKNGVSSVRGNTLTAEFFPDRKLRNAKAVGSAELTDVSDERTATVRGAELTADFGRTGAISTAKASGSPVAVLVPTASTSYSKATISALRAISLTMKASGGIEGANTDGRTTLRLDVPNSSPSASAKTVAADSVKTIFHPDGKFIARAEAVGNAELLVEPLNAARENYKSITYAPRFDCEFFQTGNNVKVCDAFTKTRTIRTPTIAVERHSQPETRLLEP